MKIGTADQMFTILDTEEKQCQCILDLMAILTANNDKLKPPVFPPEATWIDMVKWLLRRLGPLAKGNPWFVDTYHEKGIERYRFCVYKYYHSQRVDSLIYHIPLDFLPWLEPRDPKLHELIVCTIALLCKQCNLPLWDEDGDYSEAQKTVFGEKYSDTWVVNKLQRRSDNFETQGHIYKAGYSLKYLALIRRVKRTVTPGTIHALLREFNKISQRKHYMICIMKQALQMAITGDDIRDYTLIPSYEARDDMRPITPLRTIKFIWSEHPHDEVSKEADKAFEQDRQKYGKYLPLAFTITKPGEKVTLPKNEGKPDGYYRTNAFPEDMWTFFRELSTHIHRHRAYYYKNSKLDNDTTPSERLMQLEAQKMQQAVERKMKKKSKSTI